MSIGPDATELLTGKPSEPAGAAPVADKAPETKPGEVPPGYAPIRALQGEQEVARQAREALANRDAQLRTMGFQVGEDGTVVAPAPAPQTFGIEPEVQALADSIGVDAAQFQAAIDRRIVRTGGAMLDPITRHGFEQSKREYTQDDPDFPVYSKTFQEELDRRVGALPPEYRAVARVHPDFLRDAKAAARDRHFEELVTRAADRKAKGIGTVVGRFVEGAAPGSSEAPTPPPFSDSTREYLRRQGTSEAEIARLEAARAAGRAR